MAILPPNFGHNKNVLLSFWGGHKDSKNQKKTFCDTKFSEKAASNYLGCKPTLSLTYLIHRNFDKRKLKFK